MFLKKCSWYGNIRELRNALERAMIVTEERKLLAKDFSFLKPFVESVENFLTIKE